MAESPDMPTHASAVVTPLPAPRVVIADGHPSVRRALESLTTFSGAIVAGSGADLATAGSDVRRSRAALLLVDADLLADQRADLGPLPARTAIIALGMERHPEAAARARRLGAAAYFLKDQAHTVLSDLLSH